MIFNDGRKFVVNFVETKHRGPTAFLKRVVLDGGKIVFIALTADEEQAWICQG